MRRFDGVIFDMDGTLIDSRLDFAAIRSELRIDAQTGILEAIDQMPEPSGARARQKLLAYELDAAKKATLVPEAANVLAAARRAGMKIALLTRNARQVVEIVLDRFDELSFDLILSREDGPTKPEPDGVLRACRDMAVEAARVACVGDFRYEILAANAAGATSILLARGEKPDFADQADFVIESLAELPAILEL